VFALFVILRPIFSYQRINKKNYKIIKVEKKLSETSKCVETALNYKTSLIMLIIAAEITVLHWGPQTLSHSFQMLCVSYVGVYIEQVQEPIPKKSSKMTLKK
jgi:hypothetical protein